MEVPCSEFICELGVYVGGWGLSSLMRNCLFSPWDAWVQVQQLPYQPWEDSEKQIVDSILGCSCLSGGYSWVRKVGVDKGCCSLAGLHVSMSHAGQKQPHLPAIHFRTEFPRSLERSSYLEQSRVKIAVSWGGGEEADILLV